MNRCLTLDDEDVFGFVSVPKHMNTVSNKKRRVRYFVAWSTVVVYMLQLSKQKQCVLFSHLYFVKFQIICTRYKTQAVNWPPSNCNVTIYTDHPLKTSLQSEQWTETINLNIEWRTKNTNWTFHFSVVNCFTQATKEIHTSGSSWIYMDRGLTRWKYSRSLRDGWRNTLDL